MVRFGLHPWNTDPGPCPVDDTPHTACTPESVGTLTVRVRRTAAMKRAAQLAGLEPPDPPPVTFTTKTYKRGTHKRALRARD